MEHVIRPGDTLIVLYADRNVTTEDADRYREKLLQRMPDLADVVLLGNTNGVAVYRPEQATGEQP